MPGLAASVPGACMTLDPMSSWFWTVRVESGPARDEGRERADSYMVFRLRRGKWVWYLLSGPTERALARGNAEGRVATYGS